MNVQAKKVPINSVEFTKRLVDHLDSFVVPTQVGEHFPCGDLREREEENEKCTQCAQNIFNSKYRRNMHINYGCTQRNYIYAIRSMICHADEIAWAMQVSNQTYQKVFLQQQGLQFERIASSDFVFKFILECANTPLKVASIGYASGTDLLGILKLLHNKLLLDAMIRLKLLPTVRFLSENGNSLEVLRIDTQMEQWDEVAETVEQFIRNHADLDFHFTVDKNKEKFIHKTHIFILSYVLNEMTSKQVDELVNELVNLANNRFLLVINEIAKYAPYQETAWENIRRLCNGLKQSFNETNQFPFCEKQNWHDVAFYETFRKNGTGRYSEYQNKYHMKLHLKSTFYIAEYIKK